MAGGKMTISITWLVFSVVALLACLLVAQQVTHNRQMMRMSRLLSAQLNIPARIMEPEQPIHPDPYRQPTPARVVHRMSVPVPGVTPPRPIPPPPVRKDE